MPETVIRYLKPEEKKRTRMLYEVSFPEDTKDFVDYYFNYKTWDNEILVMEEQDKLQVMIHLNPFDFALCGEKVHLNYVVAVATDSYARRQGKMMQVMKKALTDMAKEHMPFTFLIPANPAVYKSSGFVFVPTEKYEETNKLLYKSIEVKKNNNLQAAEVSGKLTEAKEQDITRMAKFAQGFLKEKYDIFPCRTEAYYERIRWELQCQNGGILLLENETDIKGMISYGRESDKVLIQEMLVESSYEQELLNYMLEYFPEESLEITEMNYMVRILDLKVLCLLLRSREHFALKVKVRDEIIFANNGCYEIKMTPEGSSIAVIPEIEVECEMNIRELTQILFGNVSFLVREWV